MKWLTLDYIKAHTRIDNNCEDELLELYGESAEETLLEYVNRSYDELVEKYGKIPMSIIHASLMLVDTSYQHRSPVSAQHMSEVPYTFNILIKPYMKL